MNHSHPKAHDFNLSNSDPKPNLEQDDESAEFEAFCTALRKPIIIPDDYNDNEIYSDPCEIYVYSEEDKQLIEKLNRLCGES